MDDGPGVIAVTDVPHQLGHVFSDVVEDGMLAAGVDLAPPVDVKASPADEDVP